LTQGVKCGTIEARSVYHPENRMINVETRMMNSTTERPMLIRGTTEERKKSLRNVLITYAEEMKATFGDEYPSWQEETKIRIEQLRSWVDNPKIHEQTREMFKKELSELVSILEDEMFNDLSTKQVEILTKIDKLGSSMKDEYTKKGETVKTLTLKMKITTLVNQLDGVDVNDVLKLYN
jgi:hypothetical protein